MAAPHPDLDPHNLETVTVHASAIAAGGRAALIRGPSGAGKSDLALRCIALAPTPFLPQQASLVSDDQTVIARRGGKLYASAPARIAGLLEARGIGVVRVNDAAAGPPMPLALVVDLVPSGAAADRLPDRLPDPWPMVPILGVELPLLRLKVHEASAPIRLLLALGCHSLPATG